MTSQRENVVRLGRMGYQEAAEKLATESKNGKKMVSTQRGMREMRSSDPTQLNSKQGVRSGTPSMETY